MSFFLNTIKSTLAIVGLASPQFETSTTAAPTSSNATLLAEDPSFTSDFSKQAPVPTNTGHILTGILRPGLRPSTVVHRMQIHGFPRTLENWKVCPSAPLSFKFKKVKPTKKPHFREHGHLNIHEYRPYDPEEPANSWIPYDDAILHQPSLSPGRKVTGCWRCRICKQVWTNYGSHEAIPGYPGLERRMPPQDCPEHPRPLSLRAPEPFYGLDPSRREQIYNSNPAYLKPYTLHGGLINPPMKSDSEDDSEARFARLGDLRL